MNDPIILDSRWFSDCGIVRMKTEFDGIRYYICGTDHSDGNSQAQDEAYIASWGSTFPKDAGDVLFGIKS